MDSTWGVLSLIIFFQKKLERASAGDLQCCPVMNLLRSIPLSSWRHFLLKLHHSIFIGVRNFGKHLAIHLKGLSPRSPRGLECLGKYITRAWDKHPTTRSIFVDMKKTIKNRKINEYKNCSFYYLCFNRIFENASNFQIEAVFFNNSPK